MFENRYRSLLDGVFSESAASEVALRQIRCAFGLFLVVCSSGCSPLGFGLFGGGKSASEGGKIAGEAVNKSTVPETIMFQGETFMKGWESQPPLPASAEFFRTGENSDSWSKLIGIHYYPGVGTPKGFAEKYLRAAKESYQHVSGTVTELEDGTSVLLEFTIALEEGGLTNIESNVFRYTAVATSRGIAEGIRGYQFAQRTTVASEGELVSFADNFQKARRKVLDELTIAQWGVQ